MSLFTISDIVTYKRPDSPIGTSEYWQSLLLTADSMVRGFARRELAEANYTDKGYTVPIESERGTQYAWYLREPTGTALEFKDFTTLTLGGTAVLSTEVLIEPTRLIFDAPGYIVATYPGGYLADDTAKTILRQAVIEAMHVLHNRGTAAGFAAAPGPGFPQTLASEDDAYAQVRAMLAPYKAALDMPYAASPTD